MTVYLEGEGHPVWSLDPKQVLPFLGRPAQTVASKLRRARARWSLDAILWIVIPFGLLLLLFWSDVQRILFG